MLKAKAKQVKCRGNPLWLPYFERKIKQHTKESSMARKRGKKKAKKVITKTVTEVKRRSPVAHTAILRKGGVHQQSRSSERQKQKRSLRKAVMDYGGSRKDWKGGKEMSKMVL